MGEMTERLLRADLSLWPQGSVANNRLGWLRLPNTTEAELRDLFAMANTIDQHSVIYVGMGGSSLGAMTMAQMKKRSGPQNGRNVIFVDSTHPNFIASLPTTDTAVVLASKSGTTTEVDTIFDFFWARMKDPSRFLVITDKDSPLEKKADERGVRRIVTTPSDVGGRYSVLTGFGTVALALLSVSMEDMAAPFTGARGADLDHAEEVALNIFNQISQGRDRLSIYSPKDLDKVPMWLEQLIAESLGKQNKGIVPLPFDDNKEALDRVSGYIEAETLHELGAKFFEWEVITALLGSLLQIDPFNEPDVAAAKAATKSILESGQFLDEPGVDISQIDRSLEAILTERDYVALGGFLNPDRYEEGLTVRDQLENKFTPHAVTYGLGPRFLHSTGQLHKGGPNTVVMAQVVESTKYEHVPIPDRNYGFAELFRAQADGDLQTLRSRGRRALRFKS
ncbi:glucose-6-phosphate isomerase [Ferrithrix thermotolerans DSM 19514]|uniref:Glucose-6-phosphate isomerase n=1 Tax=Ferrithrix thermotolerans DSM 19514 TaxID=1121881 RepID=A0A1M4X8N6_9ACTN|nr:hypothetical protein [Ferrithrix thermotolerans]SHE89791.1 glucose-6-phosphate isomerase [Ferrithrix thermotolerans DSM 19514]